MACVYSSNPGTQLVAKNRDFCACPQTSLTKSLVSSVLQSSFVKMIDCWSFEVVMFLLSQTLWNVIFLQMCEINESPLFLKLNPLAKTNDVSSDYCFCCLTYTTLYSSIFAFTPLRSLIWCYFSYKEFKTSRMLE